MGIKDKEFLIDLEKLYLSIIGSFGEDIPIINLFNSLLKDKSKFLLIILLSLLIKILIFFLLPIAWGISENSKISELFICW